ncbi:MAG: chemotaxis-specific protein-glutamate methyltransferase CheB [Treponema sp.]|nr:chemotaxis-specific protein-glutamate methyltransferase CheB [Treponema sp.]
MRNLIGRMVAATPGLAVLDKAMNGRFALDKLERGVSPDIIVLDIEMPEMNGIEFLKERKKRGITIPVVILSSIARRGAEITMEALALGASDFIQKPSGSESEDIHLVKDILVGMLLGYGGSYRKMNGKKIPAPGDAGVPKPVSQPVRTQDFISHLTNPQPATPANPPQRNRQPGKIEVIAIGISTGGPDALRVVFSQIDPDLQVPILVVQHMPPGFTCEFAKSLDRICPLNVKEAEDEDPIKPGQIIVAQGNRHLEIERRGFNYFVRLSDTPLVSGHRPSADVLFASVAMAYQNRALGVIMTGMGRDGAQHLGTIYKEGGITLGQDEESSVVYGMPRVAYEFGHVMEQVPLQKMAARICEVAKATNQVK